MLVLGLTGPSGAGKGALGAVFSRRGIPSLDTDAIYHTLLIPPSPCLDALTDAFGSAILAPDGSLNRQALAGVVFGPDAPPEKLTRLNAITHRYILDECRKRIAAYRAEGKRAVLVDAPLLYESGFDRECDYVIAVIAPQKTRLSRIMARDRISETAALARIRAQKEDSFYTAQADFVVVNDGGTTPLEDAADAILAQIGGRSS